MFKCQLRADGFPIESIRETVIGIAEFLARRPLEFARQPFRLFTLLCRHHFLKRSQGGGVLLPVSGSQTQPFMSLNQIPADASAVYKCDPQVVLRDGVAA